MLIKIKQGDETLQFDSKDVLIAVLFTPSDKETIKKMEHDDLLYMSGPFQVLSNGVAAAWQWAMNGWKGAKYVDRQSIQMSRQFEKTRRF